MKILIILITLLISFSILGKQNEKTLEIQAHINKISFDEKNRYRLELREMAAVYHSDEKNLLCLQKSINENKLVTLSVTAYSLNIINCEINSK